MKMLSTHTAMAMGVAVGLACALSVMADDSPTAPVASARAQKEMKFTGTLLSIDPEERTATVKSFGLKRTFNPADSCKVSLADKPEATLAELRPGQQVVVTYSKQDGVFIARQIAQENRTYSGHITALDSDSRTFTVKQGLFKKNFVAAQDATLRFADNQSGSLDDLKVGHTVTVVYEEQDGLRAQQIEQTRETFVGTIRAIDASRKTVKARNLMTERNFHLVNGCQIVIENRTGARLQDLRIGDRVALTYEDEDGVLLVNRIGREDSARKTGDHQTARVNE